MFMKTSVIERGASKPPVSAPSGADRPELTEGWRTERKNEDAAARPAAWISQKEERELFRSASSAIGIVSHWSESFNRRGPLFSGEEDGNPLRGRRESRASSSRR